MTDGIDPRRPADVDDLLFVVPCRNEEDAIAAVLANLLADRAAGASPIIVVDGESTDQTPSIVSALAAQSGRIRLIQNSARLQSAGVNLAVRLHGEGRRFLIRVDAHADYPTTYGSDLRKVALETDATSVVVPMEAQGTLCFQKAVAAAQNSRLSNGGAPHRIGGRSGWVDHGHHALIRIDAFTAAGGYNPQFATNEDAELDERLSAAGGRIWLSAAQGIIYHPRSTAKALFTQYARYGRGRRMTHRLHRRAPKIRQWIPILLGPAVLPSLCAPLLPTPFAILAIAPTLIWAGACLSYGGVLALKAREACVAASGWSAMIMHLAWSYGYWRELIGPSRVGGSYQSA